MHNALYLDTARLGQMTPRACRASVDYTRFAGEYGGSLYLTQLLKEGHAAWPMGLRSRFPGLMDWKGIGPFQQRLLELVQARPSTRVVVASRTAFLMATAARLLFGPCRNVLITDLTWPSYEWLLRNEQRSAARRVTKVSLRKLLFEGDFSRSTIVEFIESEYRRNQCDGLLLPAVDCLGVRLPVSKIVERIRNVAELRFAVIDGAQAVNHVPIDLDIGCSDFLIAGCHKWLGAFNPMGIAFIGNPETAGYIRDSIDRWRVGPESDPLLAFTHELQTSETNNYGETVSVASLFTANAAVEEALHCQQSDYNEIIESNVRSIIDVSQRHAWRPLSAGKELSTRILLLQSPFHSDRASDCDSLRSRFQSKGIVLTTYPGGFVRISIPSQAISSDDLETLESVLRVSTERRGAVTQG